MAKVTSIQQGAAKFVSRAAAASTDYAAAAIEAAPDWARNTAAAEANFAAGVQAAIAEKRFGSGVAKAGPDKYRRGVEMKGANRFGPGVAAAEPDYIAATEPFYRALATINYPPRRPTRDPANIQRVQAVINAMIAAKKAQR
jgi:hypothetical protein